MFLRLSSTETVNVDNIIRTIEYPTYTVLVLTDGTEYKVINSTNRATLKIYTDANQIS